MKNDLPILSIMYSVVIPVYNSEKTIIELHKRIKQTFDEIKADFEIVFIDDNSKDNSWQVLTELAENNKNIQAIQLMRNFGQHNALMCGFHYARGNFIITMDDDLQNPPEEIHKLIAKLDEGFDLVYGTYLEKKHSRLRNLGSLFVQMLYKKTFGLKNTISPFRIISGQVIEKILSYDSNFVFLDGLLAWNTSRINTVYVQHQNRKDGKSGYTLRKLISLSVNMAANFSIIPLQLASLIGFLFSIIGFLMAVIFFIKKLVFDIPVTGYTSLIVAITIFAGIQLMTLGLIGEYIGRIHINVNKKPQFAIRNKIIRQ